MKKYIDAELMIVSIQKNDIVTASTTLGFGSDLSSGDVQASDAGRRMDDWDAGY